MHGHPDGKDGGRRPDSAGGERRRRQAGGTEIATDGRDGSDGPKERKRLPATVTK